MALTVINVRTMQSRVILNNSLYTPNAFRTSLMDLLVDKNSKGFVTLFNLEVDQEKVDRFKEVNVSTIKKYSINLDYLECCFE